MSIEGHDGSITQMIREYTASVPDHRSGTVDDSVLQALERLAPTSLDWTMETGCGKTTIFLSNLSRRHNVFSVDDTEDPDGSVNYVNHCPLYRPDRTRFIAGPTQHTLPSFSFDCPIDLALLDGPHGYPFPELEYFHVYPHLRAGALLVIDDIHIPTIHHLYSVIAEDEMFELLHVERTTAFLRRTHAPTLSPTADGWWLQQYNKARFPVPSPHERATPVDATHHDQAIALGETNELLTQKLRGLEATEALLTQKLRGLGSDNASLQQQLAVWQEIAEQRRLSRRLIRRAPFLRSWLNNLP